MATIKDIRRRNLLSLLDEHASQAAIARVLEVEPAYVSALLTGPPKGRDIGDKTARKIEARFEKPEGWMDQPNYTVNSLPKKSSLRYSAREGAPARSASLEAVAILDDLRPVDVITVSRLEIRASMGAGELRPGHDAVAGTMQLSAEWIRRHLPDVTSPKNLRIITGYGDSMEPTFRDGDILIVDTGVREVRIDTIYVFALDDELYVKTLQRVPGVGLRVISDNKKYETYLLEEETWRTLDVLGRVVWTWNGRKL
jgi:phage repressor protein C with HTH and peptisase S24 domain